MTQALSLLGVKVRARFSLEAASQFDEHGLDDVEFEVLRDPFVEMVDVCAGLHQKPEWFKALTCSTPKAKAFFIWASRVSAE